jgi:hypothetical protein
MKPDEAQRKVLAAVGNLSEEAFDELVGDAGFEATCVAVGLSSGPGWGRFVPHRLFQAWQQLLFRCRIARRWLRDPAYRAERRTLRYQLQLAGWNARKRYWRKHPGDNPYKIGTNAGADAAERAGEEKAWRRYKRRHGLP